MEKNEYKILQDRFKESGLWLEENSVFGSIDIVGEYSGAPLRAGKTITQYGLVPCFPDDDFEDVLVSLVRFADSFDRNIQAFTIYNGVRGADRPSWDDCDKIALDFATRINNVADVLSTEYNIDRDPHLMSMDASVLEWCEAALITDEEYEIDPSLTFRMLDMSSENRRIELCGGDKALAETLALTLETRHDNRLYDYRTSELAKDLLVSLAHGDGDWRGRRQK